MTKKELEQLSAAIDRLQEAAAKQFEKASTKTTTKKAETKVDALTMREIEIAAELGAEATLFISKVLAFSKERINSVDKITAEQGLKIVAGQQTLASMLAAVLDMAIIRDELAQSAISASNETLKKEQND